MLKIKKLFYESAVTRIRTWVTAATTEGTNHYTITAVRFASRNALSNVIFKVDKKLTFLKHSALATAIDEWF
jgi:hypothetical protein